MLTNYFFVIRFAFILQIALRSEQQFNFVGIYVYKGPFLASKIVFHNKRDNLVNNIAAVDESIKTNMK